MRRDRNQTCRVLKVQVSKGLEILPRINERDGGR